MRWAPATGCPSHVTRPLTGAIVFEPQPDASRKPKPNRNRLARALISYLLEPAGYGAPPGKVAGLLAAASSGCGVCPGCLRPAALRRGPALGVQALDVLLAQRLPEDHELVHAAAEVAN